MDILTLFLAISFMAFGLKLFHIFVLRLKKRTENNDGQTADGKGHYFYWTDSIEIAVFALMAIILGASLFVALAKKHFL